MEEWELERRKERGLDGEYIPFIRTINKIKADGSLCHIDQGYREEGGSKGLREDMGIPACVETKMEQRRTIDSKLLVLNYEMTWTWGESGIQRPLSRDLYENPINGEDMDERKEKKFKGKTQKIRGLLVN